MIDEKGRFIMNYKKMDLSGLEFWLDIEQKTVRDCYERANKYISNKYKQEEYEAIDFSNEKIEKIKKWIDIRKKKRS